MSFAAGSYYQSNRKEVASAFLDPKDLSQRLEFARIQQASADHLHCQSGSLLATGGTKRNTSHMANAQPIKSSMSLVHDTNLARARHYYRQSIAEPLKGQSFSRPTRMSFPDPEILIQKLEAYQTELKQIDQRRRSSRLSGAYTTAEFETFILGPTQNSMIHASIPCSFHDENVFADFDSQCCESSRSTSARSPSIPLTSVPRRTSSKVDFHDAIIFTAPPPVVRRGPTAPNRKSFALATSIDQRVEPLPMKKPRSMNALQQIPKPQPAKSLSLVRSDTNSTTYTAPRTNTSSIVDGSGYETGATSLHSTPRVGTKAIHSKSNSTESAEDKIDRTSKLVDDERKPPEAKNPSTIRSRSENRKRSSSGARLSLFPVPPSNPALSRPVSRDNLRALALEKAKLPVRHVAHITSNKTTADAQGVAAEQERRRADLQRRQDLAWEQASKRSMQRLNHRPQDDTQSEAVAKAYSAFEQPLQGMTADSVRLLREKEKILRWRADREKAEFEHAQRVRELAARGPVHNANGTVMTVEPPKKQGKARSLLSRCLKKIF